MVDGLEGRRSRKKDITIKVKEKVEFRLYQIPTLLKNEASLILKAETEGASISS